MSGDTPPTMGTTPFRYYWPRLIMWLLIIAIAPWLYVFGMRALLHLINYY